MEWLSFSQIQVPIKMMTTNFCIDCRGKTFDNGKSTISTVGTICGGKAVGISVDVNVFQPHIVAANLAHSIGW